MLCYYYSIFYEYKLVTVQHYIFYLFLIKSEIRKLTFFAFLIWIQLYSQNNFHFFGFWLMILWTLSNYVHIINIYWFKKILLKIIVSKIIIWIIMRVINVSINLILRNVNIIQINIIFLINKIYKNININKVYIIQILKNNLLIMIHIYAI